MARPRKATVDYFPHACVHGKTMYILEQRHGNDGYAFWFKLLERLGRQDGHFLDMSDELEIEFLAAETRLSPGLTSEILDLLARLNAIDRDLWQKSRIIWAQNFVDGIADAYKERLNNLPTKPVSRQINKVSPPINEVSPPQSGGEIPKLNKTRVNKKKKTAIPPDFKISESVTQWAAKNGHTHLEKHLTYFIDKCMAKGYEYVDFDRAFMGAIRDNWANINNNHKPSLPAKPQNITDEDWQFYLRFKKEPYGTMEQNERFDLILKQIGAV